MKRRSSRLAVAALFLVALPLAAQGGSAGGDPFTAGDVEFMQGMIHHHAQALVMAAMAPSHGASARVQLLCQKIALSQRDEIGMMRQWLQFRKRTVPDTAPHSMTMTSMPGMDMSATMPGMLTEEQMQQLDRARGTDFDRLFLNGMIQHHRGALKMVADLIAAPPSGQGSEIFRFITDVDADQRAEIGVMQQMLYNLPRSSAP